MPGKRSSHQRFIRKNKKKRLEHQNTKKTSDKVSNPADHNASANEEVRLNKYIAHSGFCSRREADSFIEGGKVKVNGKVTTEMGIKIKPSDKVEVDGQNLSLESFVYILLHKPKNTITTTSDDKNRRTVMDLIEDATGYRVYPIGRLDRDTTGLLLLTNDGDLAHRLTHPSYTIRKTYELETARTVTIEEMEKLKAGIELEDGKASAYNIKYVFTRPNTISLSIHEGRNRQIRRMAAALGHEVVKLKRVQYAGLGVKDVSPGRWRFLRQREVNALRKQVKLEPLNFNKKDDIAYRP